MYARVVQATVRPKRLEEFKNAVRTCDVPAIRRQPGFVDDIEMYLGNRFLGISFWKTEQDADRFARELFPQLAARSEPLVSDTTLRAERYNIEGDTIHRIELETPQKTEVLPIRKAAAAA